MADSDTDTATTDAQTQEAEAVEEQTAADAGKTGATNTSGNDESPPWGDDFDPQRAHETIQNLRKVEKDLNKQLKAAQAKVKEFEDASKSDVEKLTSERDSLKDELASATTMLREMQAQVALSAAGATTPELLVGKIPADAFEDESDLKREVGKLKRAYPQLFRATTGDAGGGETGGKTGEKADMDAIIRKRLGRA